MHGWQRGCVARLRAGGTVMDGPSFRPLPSPATLPIPRTVPDGVAVICALKQPHAVYCIEVTAGSAVWHITKRFSEFKAVHDGLRDVLSPPCSGFPNEFRRSGVDDGTIRYRIAGLEAWCNAACRRLGRQAHFAQEEVPPSWLVGTGGCAGPRPSS